MINIIKKKKDKDGIKKRCGDNIIAGGIECSYCGCFETYKDGNESGNTEKWYFMIRAFRVDSSSFCTNCKSWFEI